MTGVILQESDQEMEVVIGNCAATPPSSPPDSVLPRSVSPAALKHYRARPAPARPPSQHVYLAPSNQAGLKRKCVLGLSGPARNNVVWLPSTGELLRP